MAIVTRSNYIENLRTTICSLCWQVISYRQKSQPCTGGSNQEKVSYALAAERKRSTVGSHLANFTFRKREKLLKCGDHTGAVQETRRQEREQLLSEEFLRNYLSFRFSNHLSR